MPMPQSAVRGSPVTERRQGTPALSSAAETIDSGSSCTGIPSTQMVTLSGMRVRLCGHALRQVGRRVDLRPAPQHLVREQASGGWSVGDAKPLEAGSEPKRAVVAETLGRPDERQLVRRSSAETGPDA